MNPKNLSVRMDRVTGEMWLTEEKYSPGKPRTIKRIANIDQHILLCLCADLYHENGTKEVTRYVKFADGTRARISARDITDEPEETAEDETRL